MVNVENDDNNDEDEEELIEEEDVKGEAIMNDGEYLIEEMTLKLKKLYENKNVEIQKVVKEKELILFEEDGSIVKMDSIDDDYIEDLSLEKLNNIKFEEENVFVFY